MNSDPRKIRIPADVFICIYYLSCLYGAITKIKKKEDSVYSTSVCLGSSYEISVSIPCYNKIGIDE